MWVIVGNRAGHHMEYLNKIYFLIFLKDGFLDLWIDATYLVFLYLAGTFGLSSFTVRKITMEQTMEKPVAMEK